MRRSTWLMLLALVYGVGCTVIVTGALVAHSALWLIRTGLGL